MEVLGCVSSRKCRMVLTTMYATGLRVGEAVSLSVRDIDSRQMSILVARGKGNKQRLVPLSRELLLELRHWWLEHHNPHWMFPGARADRPLDRSTVQRSWKTAVQRIGLRKPASTHALRHTFAAELFEAGVDLLTIQRILGHPSLSTTVKYTHVRRDHLQATCEVLELLPLEQLRTVSRPPADRRPRRRKSAK
jgi:site-specific recombinase XerD